MPQLELLTLVVYDISDDRTRTRVSEACKDFGLVRFQYSAFEGLLTRNRREELALVLAALMADKGGKATLIPICRTDCEGRLDLDCDPTDDADSDGPRPLKVFAGDAAEVEDSDKEPD